MSHWHGPPSRDDAMTQGGGTSDKIYARLKAALVAGTIESHAKLDIARLAATFGVSPTPIREAAMRLFGEGLLEGHPHGGMRPLFVSEIRLRSLLELHAQLLSLAVNWASPDAVSSIRACYSGAVWEDYRQLFSALAQAPDNLELTVIFDRLGDRLAAFRLVEQEIIPDVSREFEALRDAIASGSIASLKRLLKTYHRRRIAQVAQLAWLAARKHLLETND